jgi:hypothetical protein
MISESQPARTEVSLSPGASPGALALGERRQTPARKVRRLLGTIGTSSSQSRGEGRLARERPLHLRKRTHLQARWRSPLGQGTNPLPRESVARAGCGLDGANHVIERR